MDEIDGKTVLLTLLLAAGLGAVACNDDPVQTTELARIRAVHVSPSAPSVDVYVEGLIVQLFTDEASSDATDYSQGSKLARTTFRAGRADRCCI
jgi:hypothetical protein